MEIEHQVFYNPPSSLVPPPLPPPVPSPSQPPVPTTPPDMDVDQNDCMSISKCLSIFVPIIHPFLYIYSSIRYGYSNVPDY